MRYILVIALSAMCHTIFAQQKPCDTLRIDTVFTNTTTCVLHLDSLTFSMEITNISQDSVMYHFSLKNERHDTMWLSMPINQLDAFNFGNWEYKFEYGCYLNLKKSNLKEISEKRIIRKRDGFASFSIDFSNNINKIKRHSSTYQRDGNGYTIIRQCTEDTFVFVCGLENIGLVTIANNDDKDKYKIYLSYTKVF
jgi:hypothetical protein